MANRIKNYEQPRKLTPKENRVLLLQKLYEWGSENVSEKNIAIRLGATVEQLVDVLFQVENGIRPYQMAYDAGKAEFERFHAQIIADALDDPDTSHKDKARIAFASLKTLKNWAPATQVIQIQQENVNTIYEVDSLTEEEIAAIRAKHNKNDNEDNS